MLKQELLHVPIYFLEINSCFCAYPSLSIGGDLMLLRCCLLFPFYQVNVPQLLMMLSCSSHVPSEYFDWVYFVNSSSLSSYCQMLPNISVQHQVFTIIPIRHHQTSSIIDLLLFSFPPIAVPSLESL